MREERIGWRATVTVRTVPVAPCESVPLARNVHVPGAETVKVFANVLVAAAAVTGKLSDVRTLTGGK